MEEKRQVALLIGATLLLGLSALLFLAIIPSEEHGFSGDLFVESYGVTWKEDGELTERYVYSVQSPDAYRMLFRTWKAPLIYGDTAFGDPHIRLISATAPAGSTAYLKTESGLSIS